jgi:lipoyl(octanoyl) transferase
MINDRLKLAPLQSPASGAAPVEWRVAASPVGYAEAVALMEKRAAAIAAGSTAPELVWLLEHPPLFTAGTSARGEDLAGTERFPVHATGRGGRLTYHGPGQRVGYAMLDLKRRGADVRRYVLALEEWIIRALARFDVKGERRADRIGVWVERPGKGEGCEDKIAALGIRVKRWVTLHGISLNVAPDLTHYAGVLPCGVNERKWGVTSLADLGVKASMDDVDAALRASFEEIFGPVVVTDEARETV